MRSLSKFLSIAEATELKKNPEQIAQIVYALNAYLYRIPLRHAR
jgi:hypothetical protein